MREQQVQEWRTPIAARLLFPAVGLSLLIGSILEGQLGPVTTFTIPLLGLCLILGPFRPRIHLDGDTIFARGLVFSRTIPLSDLEGAVPAWGGMQLLTKDGRTFEVLGVAEKWNITKWLGRRGKGDQVAELLLEARKLQK